MEQVFQKGLANANWHRYFLYARRVKTLRHHDERSRSRTFVISSTAFIQILSYLPRDYRHLLPAAHTIVWKACTTARTIHHLLPFLSPTLRSLTLSISSSDREETSQALLSLAAHQELKLSALSILAGCNTEVEEAIATFLSHQKEVVDLTLPLVSGGGPLVQELLRSSPLRSFSGALRFASTPDIEPFFSSFIANHSQLQSLDLRFSDSQRDEGPALPFEIIRPLLQCRALRCLKLLSRRIQLEQSDIEEMGAAWRSLEKLELRRLSRYHEDGSPSSWLAVFAEAFPPGLQTLSLDFVHDDNPTLDDGRAAFPSLKTLNIGCWTVTPRQLQSTSEYLAWLCPEGVTIQSEGSWQNKDQWREVQNLVDMAHRFRVAGRRQAVCGR